MKMPGEDFDRLVNATTILPALWQNETNPYPPSVIMKEHIDVWDFELTEEEMAQLTALDKNDRFADY